MPRHAQSAWLRSVPGGIGADLFDQPPGQPDIHFGTLPGDRFDLDFPPMITDDLVHLGQAHAGAVGFGGEKGVEEIGQVLGRNADPGVPQGQTHPLGLRRHGSAPADRRWAWPPWRCR